MRYLAVVAIVLLAVVVFSGEADGQDYCRADFNGDTRIDFADFLFFVQAFNQQVSCEGYSFRDTTVVTRIDTLRMTVRDTLIVEVEDTTRINTLTQQRDSARADASEWRGKYDGLKNAYDHNRTVLLSDTAVIERNVIGVINSLPDTTQAFIRERLSITCVGGSTPSTPTSSGGGISSPDLIVESPSVDNTTLTPGQSLTLSATVRNQGTAEVAATTLRYYQSSDATITTDDTAVGKDAVPDLAASATSEQSSSVTAPLTAGTYYYGACVEAVSGESNTNNNCSDGVRVTVSSGGGSSGGGSGGGSSSPDLIVESPSVDNTTPTPGQSLTLSATVRNQGTAEVAATTLRYYQSSDATITADDTAVGTDAVSELSASATSEQSSSVTAPSTAGTYYYGACVVAVSGESNTNNNCSDGVRVTVSSGGGGGGGGSGGSGGSSSPDLIVESLSVDNTTPTAGRSITLSVTVRNHQSTGQSSPTRLYIYLSADATITQGNPGDTYVGQETISSLEASTTSELTSSFSVPLTAGTYYYGVCVASTSGDNCSDGVRVTVSSGGGDSEIVSIPDERLYTKIRSELGIDYSAPPITRADMVKLTELKATWGTHSLIHDLTGLEYAINLKKLHIDRNPFSDLTPLSGLTNLTSLILRGCGISDLTPLAGLTNLTYLNLSSNPFSDLTPLAGLTNLTYLNLGSTRVLDISPLVENQTLGKGDTFIIPWGPTEPYPNERQRQLVVTLGERGVLLGR